MPSLVTDNPLVGHAVDNAATRGDGVAARIIHCVTRGWSDSPVSNVSEKWRKAVGKHREREGERKAARWKIKSRTSGSLVVGEYPRGRAPLR